MQLYSKMLAILAVPACQAFLLPLAAHQPGEANQIQGHKNARQNLHKMNAKINKDIAMHGLLLWSSMGFLMPLGILVIRLSIREENRARAKAFFYIHVILQVLSLLLATSGAILSIKTFENSFDNHHQRIGLILYVAIWVQALTGLLRPRRGTKRRSTWYFSHWILGTAVSLLGIINIYTGIMAFHDKTSRATWVWNILFTAQVSLIAFLYLFVDKWDYMRRQGVASGGDPTTPSPNNLTNTQVESGKELVLVPCSKHNALKNLFD
ncbi:cytochrome b561 domain-containing protein At4g18260 [Rhodamnia argentea]|uniref:Cytochrome b561 domain-containing protein At4g18260 n=1 Tax=Rhodamnia argentea TaxID=178133 RepID=A0A8B8MLA8_9MYRT|nr:cytochrome b561 domain-containing protein At4g18260 [Rhodamnia argentea]